MVPVAVSSFASSRQLDPVSRQAFDPAGKLQFEKSRRDRGSGGIAAPGEVVDIDRREAQTSENRGAGGVDIPRSGARAGVFSRLLRDVRPPRHAEGSQDIVDAFAQRRALFDEGVRPARAGVEGRTWNSEDVPTLFAREARGDQ